MAQLLKSEGMEMSWVREERREEYRGVLLSKEGNTDN